ncbi:MAG: DUF3179 domain-containing protein [bacterium]
MKPHRRLAAAQVYLLLAALILSAILSAAQVSAQGLSAPVGYWRRAWPKTDFTKHSVPLNEIKSGGPPRDGIPPVDNPKFVSVEQAAKWVGPMEPVMVFSHGGDVRAYPLQILMFHEIVNDVVGGRPVVITFCPLCNSALVFDRKVKGRVLDFGTTGKLRNSDLVMWDRQTESWWQQLVGEAIVGELTGTRLDFLPSPLVSFQTFREAHPGGKVLSRETGYARNYGSNPYIGYDGYVSPIQSFFPGRVDKRLPAMERVVALELGGEIVAYPYSELAKQPVVNSRVGGKDVVIYFKKGTVSALDGSRIRGSRDVGSTVVFLRKLDGRTLNFAAKNGQLVDKETGSRWNMLGQAVAGPLRGKKLKDVVYANHFAFAWLAFRPASKIYRAK